MNDPKAIALVEVRVGSINQLFDTFDPTPYPRKDLAQSTENFIVGWTRELPRNQPIKIVLYLPTAESESAAVRQIGDAFSNYFRYRADRSRLDRKELFRLGFWSLLIGISVLALCMVIGQFIVPRFETNYLSQFFREGLIILGWVANWKPLEIFLYEWLPLVRQQKLYSRLANAAVEVKSYGESAI